ncbi:unnamed protein product [Staurois parvus]|uniref:Uncharacterized protein n=1 Tax=Staurois parvus TaxID=386267 RepID=A0ABN9G205_9NEOB|nr:unnamed protein product [Staurois parvus]
MPLVPFSYAFLSLGKDTGAPDPLLPGGPISCQSAPGHILPCFAACR